MAFVIETISARCKFLQPDRDPSSVLKSSSDRAATLGHAPMTIEFSANPGPSSRKAVAPYGDITIGNKTHAKWFNSGLISEPINRKRTSESRVIKALILTATLIFAAPVYAQTQTGNNSGDASKDMTNCPSGGPHSTTGTSSSAMAVEKSAILPSAENHDKSAAPTVQRDGESVEVRPDCPQDAKQPPSKN